MASFLDATVAQSKVTDVCQALENVLKDSRFTLAQRYKVLMLTEFLILQSNHPDIISFFKKHHTGIMKHLTVDGGDSIKGEQAKQIAQRVMAVLPDMPIPEKEKKMLDDEESIVAPHAAPANTSFSTGSFSARPRGASGVAAPTTTTTAPPPPQPTFGGNNVSAAFGSWGDDAGFSTAPATKQHKDPAPAWGSQQPAAQQRAPAPQQQQQQRPAPVQQQQQPQYQATAPAPVAKEQQEPPVQNAAAMAMMQQMQAMQQQMAMMMTMNQHQQQQQQAPPPQEAPSPPMSHTSAEDLHHLQHSQQQAPAAASERSVSPGATSEQQHQAPASESSFSRRNPAATAVSQEASQELTAAESGNLSNSGKQPLWGGGPPPTFNPYEAQRPESTRSASVQSDERSQRSSTMVPENAPGAAHSSAQQQQPAAPPQSGGQQQVVTREMLKQLKEQMEATRAMLHQQEALFERLKNQFLEQQLSGN